MNKVIKKEIFDIENMIYEVRGVEIMIDSDLANLYHVETKRINEAVKNNPEKFPERYLFRITETEYFSLKSKNSTSKGGSRKGHTVFTEQGIYMLATILKSQVATNVSIQIMDTFVKMRHYINYNKDFLPRRFLLLEDQVDNNTKRINELFDKFNPKDIVKNYIFFEGEFYDAYSLFIDILNSTKDEVIIIDNYAGKELLDILKIIDKKIIIVSKNIDIVLKSKYEKQYKNVRFINNISFHDRFIIVDRKITYLCGSSFKDLGKKCFAISKIELEDNLDILIKKIFK